VEFSHSATRLRRRSPCSSCIAGASRLLQALEPGMPGSIAVGHRGPDGSTRGFADPDALQVSYGFSR
jgi:hypothetical protein